MSNNYFLNAIILCYYSGNFDILDDELSPEPVSVALHDEKYEQVWTSKNGASEGIFSHLGAGVHYFCVQNGMSGGMTNFFNQTRCSFLTQFSMKKEMICIQTQMEMTVT